MRPVLEEVPVPELIAAAWNLRLAHVGLTEVTSNMMLAYHRIGIRWCFWHVICDQDVPIAMPNQMRISYMSASYHANH